MSYTVLGPFEPRKDAVATVAKGAATCTLLAKVLYSRAFRVGRQTARGDRSAWSKAVHGRLGGCWLEHPR